MSTNEWMNMNEWMSVWMSLSEYEWVWMSIKECHMRMSMDESHMWMSMNESHMWMSMIEFVNSHTCKLVWMSLWMSMDECERVNEKNEQGQSFDTCVMWHICHVSHSLTWVSVRATHVSYDTCVIWHVSYDRCCSYTHSLIHTHPLIHTDSYSFTHSNGSIRMSRNE